MEESIIFAKKYLEDLLSFFGLNTDVYATSEDGEVIELHVPSTHLNGFLIGQDAETLRAMQYTVSMALRNKDFEVTRVNVDVADYKKQRAHRLEDTAVKWLEEVKKSGKDMHLQPMNSADRRTIHKLAEEHGLVTESEGFGRDRHIVVKVAAATADIEEEAPTKPAEPAQDDTTEEDSEE
jgi:spoIIIJ-associated protein